MTKKGKNLPIWKCHVTLTKKDAYLSNKLQLQRPSSTFTHKNKSLHPATSILSRSPMAHNTTASLDKLNFTEYVDFGKSQDRFGQFPWSNNDFSYLDVKLKVFKKDDNKKFRLVQNVTMGNGKADFNQFMRFTSQLLIGAVDMLEKNLSPVLITTLSKDMDEQLNLAHKVVDVGTEKRERFV